MPSRKQDATEARLSSIEHTLSGMKNSISLLLLMVTIILALIFGAIIKMFFG